VEHLRQKGVFFTLFFSQQRLSSQQRLPHTTQQLSPHNLKAEPGTLHITEQHEFLFLINRIVAVPPLPAGCHKNV